jgi:hypothetical protein
VLSELTNTMTTTIPTQPLSVILSPSPLSTKANRKTHQLPKTRDCCHSKKKKLRKSPNSTITLQPTAHSNLLTPHYCTAATQTHHHATTNDPQHDGQSSAQPKAPPPKHPHTQPVTTTKIQPTILSKRKQKLPKYLSHQSSSIGANPNHAGTNHITQLPAVTKF